MMRIVLAQCTFHSWQGLVTSHNLELALNNWEIRPSCSPASACMESTENHFCQQKFPGSLRSNRNLDVGDASGFPSQTAWDLHRGIGGVRQQGGEIGKREVLLISEIGKEEKQDFSPPLPSSFLIFSSTSQKGPGVLCEQLCPVPGCSTAVTHAVPQQCSLCLQGP